MNLIKYWFWMHLSVAVVLFLKLSIFVNDKELQFVFLLICIFGYQSMILFTTIEHTSYVRANGLHFFYVEDIVHFLIYLEIMTFCANLFTNIFIIMVASATDIKMMKGKLDDRRRRQLLVGFAQQEVILNNDTTVVVDENNNFNVAVIAP